MDGPEDQILVSYLLYNSFLLSDKTGNTAEEKIEVKSSELSSCNNKTENRSPVQLRQGKFALAVNKCQLGVKRMQF